MLGLFNLGDIYDHVDNTEVDNSGANEDCNGNDAVSSVL